MPNESRMTLRSLDPRAPWVISTHDLGRRPGSMRTMSPVLPAPVDLAVGMIGVPKGADIELDIRLEAVMEGVLVTGRAKAPLSGECSRCLDPLVSEIEIDFQELYFYTAEDAGEEVRLELEAQTGRRYFLDLNVKVRADWRDDERFLSRLVVDPE